jgi:hypothetical protein
MRQICNVLACWATFIAIHSAMPSDLAAQIWERFLPTSRDANSIADDSTRGNLSLTQEDGPWLIVAASFSGEGAEQQATDLARELRERYRLKTYMHEMSFNLGDESPGRGLDEYGAPVRRRYQRGDRLLEKAVLIGDFVSIDDEDAQRTLEQIKTLEPDALNVDADKTSQSMAQVRRWEDALMEKLGKPRKRGPMAQAFFTRNPLLPLEYFRPKGIDPFVAKMNEGVEHSLLDCSGNYTVKVATFRGKTVLQTSGETEEKATAARKQSFWNRRKQVDDNPLVEAAENAHLLTKELREHGFEAYEYHDRAESIVTIGSFAQAGQRFADGRVLVSPGVQQIIETFGAAYDTPADPLTGIGNDPATQRRIDQEERNFNLRLSGQQAQIVPGMNPKHVKIMRGSGKRKKVERIIPMDVYPHAIEVPRRSLSSAYAG